MGGEHFPVLVYGFVTDIKFINDNEFNICITGDPGLPIYASIIIIDTHLEKVLEKYTKYVNEYNSKIKEIDEWCKEMGKKYNRKYECKWQMALSGELEYAGFEYEQDIINEMS
jgi:hypothetical protein